MNSRTTENWTLQDKIQARAQGWDLFDVWDQYDAKVEVVIQRDDKSGIFLTDEVARQFVATRAAANDPLAEKAERLVFHSRIGKK